MCSETDVTDKTILEKRKSSSGTRKKKKTEKNDNSKNCNAGSDLNDKPQRTILEKLKSFSCFCTRKKNKDNPTLKQFNNDIKKSDHMTEKPVQSLRSYIKQKWKWTLLILVTYVIVFGAVVSTPFIVGHFRGHFTVINETEQERFIT